MAIVHTFAALADPTRRRIVELLAAQERTAGDIVREFRMSAPAISQHLRILREASLLHVRVEGQRRVHSLNPAGLKEVEDWIARTKQFWEGRLDALERELRAEDERERKKSSTQPTPEKPSRKTQ